MINFTDQQSLVIIQSFEDKSTDKEDLIFILTVMIAEELNSRPKKITKQDIQDVIFFINNIQQLNGDVLVSYLNTYLSKPLLQHKEFSSLRISKFRLNLFNFNFNSDDLHLFNSLSLNYKLTLSIEQIRDIFNFQDDLRALEIKDTNFIQLLLDNNIATFINDSDIQQRYKKYVKFLYLYNDLLNTSLNLEIYNIDINLDLIFRDLQVYDMLEQLASDEIALFCKFYKKTKLKHIKKLYDNHPDVFANILSENFSYLDLSSINYLLTKNINDVHFQKDLFEYIIGNSIEKHYDKLRELGKGIETNIISQSYKWADPYFWINTFLPDYKNLTQNAIYNLTKFHMKPSKKRDLKGYNKNVYENLLKFIEEEPIDLIIKILKSNTDLIVAFLHCAVYKLRLDGLSYQSSFLLDGQEIKIKILHPSSIDKKYGDVLDLLIKEREILFVPFDNLCTQTILLTSNLHKLKDTLNNESISRNDYNDLFLPDFFYKQVFIEQYRSITLESEFSFSNKIVTSKDKKKI